MPLGITIMMALVLGWMISFLLATFFQVWPIRCNWVVCHPTTNYPAMYVLSSVTDVILDIAILSLPISFVRKLKMSNSKKIGVTAIFGLGILYVFPSFSSGLCLCTRQLYYCVDCAACLHRGIPAS